MNKRTFSNWPRYVLQWGVLAALILFLTGIIPSSVSADPERYCPMGGLQAFVTWAVNGSLPCSMTTVQIMMGIALAAAVILFSKLFCGFICPIGTTQDLLIKARKSLHIKEIYIKNGSVADKILRIFKYFLLFWVFYMTATASELWCKNFDPYYAVATGFKGEITLWMSITAIVLTILGGFFINMFWCRYVCPLGALSDSLKFWLCLLIVAAVWYLAGELGLSTPWIVLLAALCITGYLLEILHRKPKYQILHIIKEQDKCSHCNACMKKCPYHIDIDSYKNGKVTSVDCTLCGECTEACRNGALHVGICRNGRKKGWQKFIAPVLTIILIVFGIYAGSKFEIPTIDVKWGIEQVNEDGTTIELVDESSLKTMTMTGLRSVKCYGSSMAFKARLEKIPGTHGVKTFVAHHRAAITYDPAVTNEDKIREAVFVPSRFRVETPDVNATDSIKIYTIRTENMYDKMDVNYLGMQMRASDKKIYGIETEFACPLIVRVYTDPSETLDKKWFEEIVEAECLVMPVHGGGTKEIPLAYKFISMEDNTAMMPTEAYIRAMFSPFKAQFKSRVEENAGKKQFIYEIADSNYEKPIILRNMPFLSNHLSANDGVIGIYLELNDELVPSIRIRYAEPMTADKLWELMTAETWSITYGKDDVRDVPAKLSFKTKGIVLPYVPVTEIVSGNSPAK